MFCITLYYYICIQQELLTTKKQTKMGASNSENTRTNYYQMNAKCDDNNTPKFKKANKVNGAWDYSEQFDTISGNLVNLSIGEKEFEGAKFNVFRMRLNDGTEFDQVEMSHNGLTYSILNSLLSLLTHDSTMLDLSIKLYKRKDDKGKLWPGAMVEYGGQKLPWALSMGADTIIPKSVPVLVNGKPFMQSGKQVFDSTEVKVFWEEQFKKLMEKVNIKTAVKPNEEFHQEQNIGIQPDEDGLPF